MEYAICVLSWFWIASPCRLPIARCSATTRYSEGTAIEYFDNVLPDEIKEAGMAFIGIARPVGSPQRELGEIKAELRPEPCLTALP